jgi:hypothetical protein
MVSSFSIMFAPLVPLISLVESQHVYYVSCFAQLLKVFG